MPSRSETLTDLLKNVRLAKDSIIPVERAARDGLSSLRAAGKGLTAQGVLSEVLSKLEDESRSLTIAVEDLTRQVQAAKADESGVGVDDYIERRNKENAARPSPLKPAA